MCRPDVIEAQDFYPYGAIRIDTKSGGYGGEKRKYAGTEYDSLSGLNYAMARYQSPTRGQFISEDPIFLGTRQDLTDPQSLNSYSYTTATSTHWVMVAIALRPATSTSVGGGGAGSTTVRYVHTDNLGGSSVITDPQGNVSEAEDFYPYGATRIDTKTNYGGEKRKYAGTEYDSRSGLNYAMARYQSPTRGQFISEDPVFLANPSQQNLRDPQSLNSYSYGPVQSVRHPTGSRDDRAQTRCAP